jgi:hypothetical protein
MGNGLVDAALDAIRRENGECAWGHVDNPCRFARGHAGPHSFEAAASGQRRAIVPGYEQLAKVLDDALAQAQAGKGKERHAGEGEAFHDQQIVQLCEWMGSTQGDVFQAAKKAIESTRLPPARAEAELLGAINYLAAAVLVIRRQSLREPLEETKRGA